MMRSICSYFIHYRRDLTKRQSIGEAGEFLSKKSLASPSCCHRSLFEEIWCGWRLFSDIVEFQICEIPQIFPRHSQVSPNVLLFAQTFYLFTDSFLEVLEMFKIPATIRGRWHLIQNPQTVTVSPKYSPSCGKLYSFGEHSHNKRPMCHLLTKQLLNNLQFANKSTNVCHTISKQPPFDRRIIFHRFITDSFFVPKLSLISRQLFASFSHTNWWQIWWQKNGRNRRIIGEFCDQLAKKGDCFVIARKIFCD